VRTHQVKGLLDKEEVVLAKNTEYLRGVHVVVATPASLVGPWCPGSSE
jgi:hypothetical protein